MDSEISHVLQCAMQRLSIQRFHLLLASMPLQHLEEAILVKTCSLVLFLSLDKDSPRVRIILVQTQS